MSNNEAKIAEYTATVAAVLALLSQVLQAALNIYREIMNNFIRDPNKLPTDVDIAQLREARVTAIAMLDKLLTIEGLVKVDASKNS